MASQKAQSKFPPIELAYFRPNGTLTSTEEERPTIVFLHGGESCHLEFSRVVSFLKNDYDVILVDLPGHTGSRTIPFSLDNSVGGVLHLIKTQTKSNKAHLVGLSLGGFISLEIARRQPEVVESIFCTGCTPSSGFGGWITSHPLLTSAVITLIGRIATDRMFWSSFGSDVQPIPGLREAVQRNQNVATVRPVLSELMTMTWERFMEIPGVRIGIVAGGKRDSVESARRAGDMFRRKNEECRAFVVRKAIHWWTLQYPQVFAEGVNAWIERTEMPTEYEELPTVAIST